MRTRSGRAPTSCAERGQQRQAEQGRQERRHACPPAARCARWRPPAPGRRGSHKHARAGKSHEPQPATVLSFPDGGRRCTLLATRPGSTPRFAPGLSSARTPRPCAPSRGGGTSEAQGGLRSAPTPRPRLWPRPRRSLRTPRPSLAAPLRAPPPALCFLKLGRASGVRVLQSWGLRRCGVSGADSRDYFSFESF